LRELLERNGSFIFRFITFQDIKDSLRDILGAAAYVLFYQAGIGAGRRSCERLLKQTKSKCDILEELVKLKVEENWGELHFEDVDWDRLTGRIVVVRSFESRGLKRDEPSCYFFKGYLKGFLTKLLGEEVMVEETSCIAQGGAKCEFTFRAGRRPLSVKY
jgi:predicted hydrocarbon binding protein